MVCLVSRTGRQSQRYNKGRRLVVGCIPYRIKTSNDSKTSGEFEVLVISSQKGHALMFPKGGWELDESIEEAASRESLEEAGVVGNVERQLGKWDFLSKSRGTFYEGLMFPMLVKEELELWPEQHLRQRTWMKVDEAREACRDWWMKEALDVLVQRLSSPSRKPMEEKDKTIPLISLSAEKPNLMCS
ncbi:PREDICTED: nudix hydrolase 18, mitochondrial [Camelina sativa]|uniref:Nudix hydrolase 18, mitochondrial n=1 Tax=Camelina sativa TaxID=90675 RepID=A0ABM0WUZ7_CAMSA|nr:PREDICTED: nudix hydrolase 18, mitochondrial [Camelina sativa]